MGSERKRKLPLDTYSKLVDVPRTLPRRVSHLRTCLLATLDALDDLQTPHAHELHALTEEHFKYHQAKVYERLWRDAEAEKAGMRGAVAGLVGKVGQSNNATITASGHIAASALHLTPPLLCGSPCREIGARGHASLRVSVPESRSKAVQTGHPPAHEPRRRRPKAGDVFEDARRIEEKLDRSQVDIDVDLVSGALQRI
ncbi:hypothetical protein BDN71DRAFT_1594358 [Pleurotus eryngii]|uniref:Uncharacterized protein n=1 Tax=Pleurotus eryngii TaxID=5323 RepID=A0A9P5ZH99_PLEER|nr:hypothetical protein BDN71DRAFT_1594358 [Pleurotus eryngii]